MPMTRKRDGILKFKRQDLSLKNDEVTGAYLF